MKDPEVTRLNDKELQEKLKEERALLTKLKIQHSVSSIENPKRIPAQKKLIAKILTESRQRAMKAVKQ